MGMSFYERYKLYRFNPCDIDTVLPGHALLTAIQRLHTTNCYCCTGARIAASIILAFIAGLCL